MSYAVDLDGNPACELCGGTLLDTPWVRLSAFECGDGVMGGYEQFDPEGPDIDDEGNATFSGPCFHVETCMEKWVWGLTIAGAEIARHER